MEQNFIANLPTEMTMNILLRLPVVSTLSCKCVCRGWLSLLESPEFVRTHFSKAVPALVVFEDWSPNPKQYKVFDFVDEPDPERNIKLAFAFSFPRKEIILISSENGLIFMVDGNGERLLVCNPLTREYVSIPEPPIANLIDTLGFGVSRASGQYKVVRILQVEFDEPYCEYHCQVYTLGTGSWKSVAPCMYRCGSVGTFFHGNIHWLNQVYDSTSGDLNASDSVAVFDLESERFGYFTCPRGEGGYPRGQTLSTLWGCLCMCDNSSEDTAVIWLMNSYGDVRSWTKLFVITNLSIHRKTLFPIKNFKDGYIVIAEPCMRGLKILCYYSMKLGTLTELNGGSFGSSAISYTPTFISLKTFTAETLTSF